jgi:hypothetical protein
MSTTEPTQPEDLERVVDGNDDTAEQSVQEADRRNGEPEATGGDEEAAERVFREQSAGRNTLDRQEREGT